MTKSMMIAVVVILLVLFLLIRMMTSTEPFAETSYYYSAAPGSRGERMVCMPESQGRASLGIALQNAAAKLQTTGPTVSCNTNTQTAPALTTEVIPPQPPTLIQQPPTVIQSPPSIVSCPPGSYWDGVNCVGVTASVPTCSPGFQWDGVQCRQVVPQVVTPATPSQPVLCPQGTAWNGVSCAKTSPGCPAGQIWDDKRRMCRLPVNPTPPGVACPKGYKYDTKTGLCAKTSPGCPVGSVWDGKGCRLPKNPAAPVSPGTPGVPSRTPLCPSKYQYDSKTGMCLKTSPGCPAGQIYDKKIKRCRLPKNPKPAVSILPVSPAVIPNAPVPAGTPVCPTKYAYDPKTGKCLKTDRGCAVGQIYDKKIKRCRLPKNPKPAKTPTSVVQACGKNEVLTTQGCQKIKTGAPKGYEKAPKDMAKKLSAPGRRPVNKKDDNKKVTWKGLKLRYAKGRLYVQHKKKWLRVRRVDGTWYIAKAKDSYTETRDTFEDQLLSLIDG